MRGGPIVLFLLLMLAVGCSLPEEEKQVLASVGDSQLTLDEVMSDISPYMRKHLTALDIREYVLRWIDNEVLYQEAVSQGIDEDPEVLKSLQRLRKELVINSLMQRSLYNEVVVSQASIQEYYDAHPEEFELSEDVIYVHHILVESRQEANRMRNRLKKGEVFADLAREAAEDSLAQDSWDWGYRTRREMIPEISKVAFNVAVGSFSLPIKSEFGHHIVKVVEKIKSGELKPLEMVQDDIRLKMEAGLQHENYQRFLLQTKSKFDVKTNFELLNAQTYGAVARGDITREDH